MCVCVSVCVSVCVCFCLFVLCDSAKHQATVMMVAGHKQGGLRITIHSNVKCLVVNST